MLDVVVGARAVSRYPGHGFQPFPHLGPSDRDVSEKDLRPGVGCAFDRGPLGEGGEAAELTYLPEQPTEHLYEALPLSCV